MRTIEADSNGLVSLGAACEEYAATLSAACPIAAVSGGFEATSAAVRALYIEVQGTARRISERLQATGQEVADAASNYRTTENGSARQIGSAPLVEV